jgi:hypothetical protein
MIVVFVFLGTGAALILFMLAWRDGDPGKELEEFDGPSSPLVMRRIIAQEDMLYVASLQMPHIRRFFLRERRRLALDWLRASRKEALRLLRSHKEAVRHSDDTRAAREIQIVAGFASFVVVYSAMAGTVRLFGPFRVPALLRSVEYLSDSLESLTRTMGGVVPLDRKAHLV